MVLNPTPKSIKIDTAFFKEERSFDTASECMFYTRTSKRFVFFQLIEDLIFKMGESLKPLNSYDKQLFKTVFRQFKMVHKVHDKEFTYYRQFFDEKLKTYLSQLVNQCHEDFKKEFSIIINFK